MMNLHEYLYLHVKFFYMLIIDYAFMPLEGSLGVIELHYIMNFTCIPVSVCT